MEFYLSSRGVLLLPSLQKIVTLSCSLWSVLGESQEPLHLGFLLSQSDVHSRVEMDSSDLGLTSLFHGTELSGFKPV